MHTINDKKIKLLNLIPIILIIEIIAATFLYCFSQGISGNDFWWHVKVGQWISEHGTIPTTDIFSWYGMELAIPWTAHEWLSDLILYGVHSTLGDIGIYLLSILLALLMIVLLMAQAKEYIKKNLLIAGFFFSLFTVVTSLFFYGRPHVFSYFLLFFELKILYNYIDKPDSKQIYLVPLIGCLWSNLHGGSSNLAYILCFVFLVVAAINLDYGRIQARRINNKALTRLLFVSIVTVLSILINPIGLKVFVYPYYSLTDNLMMTVISEWQAPDAKDIGALILYYFPILLMTIGFLVEERKIRLIDITVMGLFLFLFFRSARFIILWYIVASFCAIRYLPTLKVKKIKKASEKIIVCSCLVLLLVPIGYSAVKVVDSIKNGQPIRTVISDDMIEQIKKDSPARIFNDYNTGETLIYNDILVFFDARADLYAAENIMADGISLIYLERANRGADTMYVDVEALLFKYKFDGILILKHRPLYAYLISHPDRFTCLYEDSTSGYFRVNPSS